MSREFIRATAIPAIDDAAFVAEELVSLTSLIGELLAAAPRIPLIDQCGQPTDLGAAFAQLVASYSPAVQAAFWMRAQSRMMVMAIGTRRELLEVVYGCL